MVLENKKGDSGTAIPWSDTKKRQRYPYINRAPLPVSVLGNYREKGKTSPIQPRLFLVLLSAPLSWRG